MYPWNPSKTYTSVSVKQTSPESLYITNTPKHPPLTPSPLFLSVLQRHLLAATSHSVEQNRNPMSLWHFISFEVVAGEDCRVKWQLVAQQMEEDRRKSCPLVLFYISCLLPVCEHNWNNFSAVSTEISGKMFSEHIGAVFTVNIFETRQICKWMFPSALGSTAFLLKPYRYLVVCKDGIAWIRQSLHLIYI